MRDDVVPEIIRAAGEAAVRAYREFLDDPKWSASTRRLYRQQAGRFFRWAAGRGLALESIGTEDVSAYAAEIGAAMSPHSTATYQTGIRAAFRHLAAEGVISANPFENVSSSPRKECADAAGTCSNQPAPGPVGFALLDLLAMLGNMEEQALDRIFDEDAIALALLEQVRWPDGQRCPYCGSDAGDDPPAQTVCAACAKKYSVTTCTMFEDSPLPVRLWFVVIHQMYLAKPGLAEKELRRRFGLDLPAVLSLGRRIGEAVVQEALPIGDDLKRATTVRNRELGQNQVGRAIIRYAELEAVRDRLVQARAEGTTVDDLPAGMTLEDAIEKIESRIAEEDRYLITVEDGYLVRYPADSGAATSEQSGSEATVTDAA